VTSRPSLVWISCLSCACAGSPTVASEPSEPVAPVAIAEPDTALRKAVVVVPPILFSTDAGMYGFCMEDGEIVIAAKYTKASSFVDQVAWVRDDEGFEFINWEGERIATPFIFDRYPDRFVEGRARIVEGEDPDARLGFLSSNGDIVVPATWSFVLPFSDGLAAVCDGCVREAVDEDLTITGGVWGFVGFEGDVVIAPQFSAASPFVDGRAAVQQDGRSFSINRNGDEVSD
jgi:hypothetical protein